MYGCDRAGRSECMRRYTPPKGDVRGGKDACRCFSEKATMFSEKGHDVFRKPLQCFFQTIVMFFCPLLIFDFTEILTEFIFPDRVLTQKYSYL